ncbi:hypothetical protein Ancab_028853, partial [Ancistrocladus abbreviatus]
MEKGLPEASVIFPAVDAVELVVHLEAFEDFGPWMLITKYERQKSMVIEIKIHFLKI